MPLVLKKNCFCSGDLPASNDHQGVCLYFTKTGLYIRVNFAPVGCREPRGSGGTSKFAIVLPSQRSRSEHVAPWFNHEVQSSSPSELGLANHLGRFFYQPMSGLDNQLIDLIENLSCEKTQVILDRLPVVRRFVLPGKEPPDLHARASAGCCRDG